MQMADVRSAVDRSSPSLLCVSRRESTFQPCPAAYHIGIRALNPLSQKMYEILSTRSRSIFTFPVSQSARSAGLMCIRMWVDPWRHQASCLGTHISLGGRRCEARQRTRQSHRRHALLYRVFDKIVHCYFFAFCLATATTGPEFHHPRHETRLNHPRRFCAA